jgi:C4-dicarboxylate-specific signal transduction histidine kinase
VERRRTGLLQKIINAVEAMSGVSEGSRELLVDTARAGSDGVLVVVRDSGPGLPPGSIERLFDAFYTTKPVESGWPTDQRSRRSARASEP